MKQAVFKKALCMGIVMIAALLLSAGIIPAACNQPQTAILNPSTLTSSSPLVIIDIGNEGTKIYYEINLTFIYFDKIYEYGGNHENGATK
ncbi:MAG: hypothetical protein WBB08_08255 [Halobacteriota archaeon]